MTAVSLYGPYTLQNAATATGTGTPFVIGGFGTATLAVSGPFVATITVEGQGADNAWRTIGTINAPGNYTYSVTGLNAIRANITSYTSGSVTVSGFAQALGGSVQIDGSRYVDLGQVLTAGSIAAGATVWSPAYTGLQWVRNVVALIQIDAAGWAFNITRGDSSGTFDWAQQISSSGTSTGISSWASAVAGIANGVTAGVLGYQAKFGLKNTSASASTVGNLRIQLLGL